MSKHLRLSEKWFNRGLWIISFIFAWFLIGLGSAVVNDLPKVEHALVLDDFVDQVAMQPLNTTMTKENTLENEARKALRDIEEKLADENDIYRNAHETYRNWLSTRVATKRVDQDLELIDRTQNLDLLKGRVDQLERDISQQKKVLKTIAERKTEISAQMNVLTSKARQQLIAARKSQDLRVFLYRLALTLPLLLMAAWLFVKKRKKQYWPFVWGFVFFALFAFFVELVPYLPSYGGYVRYGVGIIMTLFGGHYAIRGLNHYLARQKRAEAQPETIRRKALSYDLALTRLAKSVCPGCERSINLSDPDRDFCPHCGISLFNRCTVCETRKNAFAHFCHSCGTRGPDQSGVSNS